MNRTRAQTDMERTREEAATWLVRLEAEDASAEEVERFHEWMTVSAQHRAAFQEIARTGAEFDALGVLVREAGLQLPPGLEATAAAARGLARGVRVRQWWQPRRIAVAAALFLAVLTGVLRLAVPAGHEYLTTVGERRQVTLDDGSVVDLNSDSRMKVRYESGRRLVELESGEALFAVARDAERPFIVHSGAGTVRALGTRFNVRSRGPEVTVTVLSGTVLVAPDRTPQAAVEQVDAAMRAHELVRAGEQVAYGQALGPVVRISATELMHATAWREGKLYVDDERLDAVIEEIQPYTRKRIVIADGVLQSLRVGGVFKVDDIEGVLGMLQKALPVTAVDVSPDLILLLERKEEGHVGASDSGDRRNNPPG